MADTIQYDDAHHELMKTAERQVIDLMRGHIERGVPPLLLLFALLRVSRALLRLGTSKAERKQLAPVVSAYIRGDTREPGDASILWVPDGDIKLHG
jgi:hypothetical protein